MTEETLFVEALAHVPEQRAAFLDAACAGQPELRAAVEARLAAQERSSNALDRPVLDLGQTVDSKTDNLRGPATGEYTPQPQPTQASTLAAAQRLEPGAVIAGRYTLEQRLGEGGMGEVWVARQTEPVKRRVALKLIKAGMDSRAVLARFEQERQALALMDHPNIARVLDGGMTSLGQPYFVMELVNGLPLTRFCDEAALTPRQRLELFVPICQAVQHAHQKGIIHRDLKPANIMVTLIDARPVPKVIDFGVAKATAGKLTEESLATQFGAVVGTLEYMAPEQAGFSTEDIDTRADIYSLGVILYELLTGLRPIDARRLQKAAVLEMIRMIREDEPSRPSTRLSTDEALPSLAALRQTEPRKLMALLRGELDWVVMKCLEKQRDRRYETANGLARDIQRFLADEPVEARPPSTSYRLRKFLRRNQGFVAATSLLLLALLVGIAGTTWGLLEARRQERIAREEASEKEKARAAEAERADSESRAKVAAQTAQENEARERRYAEAIAQFVKDDFLALTSVEGQERFGGEALTKDSTLRDLLDRAAKKLNERKGLDPRTEADLCWIIGVSYRGAGEFQRAIPFLERSLKLRQQVFGPNHHATLEALNSLSVAYHSAGQFDQGLQTIEGLLKIQQAELGRDHLDTLQSMTQLAALYEAVGKLDLAVSLSEETLKLRKAKLGGDYPDELAVWTQCDLAHVYLAAGKPERAVLLFEETLQLSRAKFGTENVVTWHIMNALIGAYSLAGKLDKAIPFGEETLALMKTKFGPDHPTTLHAMANLANAYQAARRTDVAVPFAEETLKLVRAKLGPEHRETLKSMNNLVLAYNAVGKLDLALPLAEELLKLQKARLGADHPDTLFGMENLAQVYKALGKPALAVPFAEETLNRTRAKFGPESPLTLNRMVILALADHAVGKSDTAVQLLEEALGLRTRTLGPDHPDTLFIVYNLGFIYRQRKQLDRSIPLHEEGLKRQEARLGRDHPDAIKFVAILGASYKDAGRLAEALPLLEEAYRASKKHPRFREVGPILLDGYVRAGNGKQAATLVQALVAEARTTLPKDSQQLAAQLAQLGLSLLQLQAFMDAEPLLRECLMLREKIEPNAWTTFNTKSLLGGALLGQKKYTDAEPLLLTGYEGMKKQQDKIPPPGKGRLAEALERLVQLYEGMGKSEEAAKWRKEQGRPMQ